MRVSVEGTEDREAVGRWGQIRRALWRTSAWAQHEQEASGEPGGERAALLKTPQQCKQC